MFHSFHIDKTQDEYNIYYALVGNQTTKQSYKLLWYDFDQR